jgi:hypothetical protein
MKKNYLFILTLFFALQGYSQGIMIDSIFKMTFEDTVIINQVFYADSIIDSAGIWQIGVPGKAFFDTAYSPVNAVMTLSDSLLPPSTKAAFIVALPPFPSYLDGGMLTFVHKFQYDSAHGGGYVEFSIDSGHTWQQITGHSSISIDSVCQFFQPYTLVYNSDVAYPTWAGPSPTHYLHDSIPYFTGTDSVWVFDTIAFPQVIIGLKTSNLTQFLFRFTSFTDSMSAPSAGWIIDDINYFSYGVFCGGGIDEVNSAHLHIYPDPATDVFNVSIANEPDSDYKLTLYDLSGRAVASKEFSGDEVTMQRSGLAAGCYFIKVLDKRTQNSFEKKIVFD